VADVRDAQTNHDVLPVGKVNPTFHTVESLLIAWRVRPVHSPRDPTPHLAAVLG
jgi:hypothetical protein